MMTQNVVDASSSTKLFPLRNRRIAHYMKLRFFAILHMALLLTGCGSGGPRPAVGAITTVNLSGAAQPPLVALVHNGGQAYFIAPVTDDDQMLGVDWQVTCSNAIPVSQLLPGQIDTSCGSFQPVHTLSGPIPSYVKTPYNSSIPGESYMALYTAPVTIPSVGTVTISAHATALPSRSSSYTFTIN